MKFVSRLISVFPHIAIGALAISLITACTSLPESKLLPVSFVLGLQEFQGRDMITVDEVRSTSPNFTIGDKVTVRGHYVLSSHQKAKLGLFLALAASKEPASAKLIGQNDRSNLPTTDELLDRDSSEPASRRSFCQVNPIGDHHMPNAPYYPIESMDSHDANQSALPAYFYQVPQFNSQALDITRGSGEFTLSYVIKQSGVLHLSFYFGQDWQPFGGIYFGTDTQMSALKNWSLNNQVIRLVDTPFILGPKGFQSGDSIVIQQILATSSELEIGSKLVLRGRYRLSSRDTAILSLHMTADNPANARERITPTQQLAVKKGSGEFTLSYTVSYTGSPHISFYGLTDGKLFGGIYFGTDRNIQNYPADPSGDRRHDE